MALFALRQTHSLTAEPCNCILAAGKWTDGREGRRPFLSYPSESLRALAGGRAEERRSQLSPREGGTDGRREGAGAGEGEERE